MSNGLERYIKSKFSTRFQKVQSNYEKYGKKF